MSDSKRPFYLIAHQCNDISDIEPAFEAGANALELDVWLTTVDGGSSYHWFASHDSPGKSSTRLDAWLSAAAGLANAIHDRFALIYFDIKTPQVAGLVGLRTLARSILPPDLNVLFSTGSLSDAQTSPGFGVFADDMRYNEGLDIDSENNPDDVWAYFHSIGVSQLWYGNGITALLPGTAHIPASIDAGVALRDSVGGFMKIFIWTLEDSDSMRTYIGKGVDGMIVEANPSGNFTDDYLKAAKDIIDATPGLRMATRSDPAFAVANPGTTGVDGELLPMHGGWTGMPASFMPPDAAVFLPNGWAYFFKGDQYLRYRPYPANQVDPSYPQAIQGQGHWSNWPSDFTALDAALFWPPTGQLFFFQGDQYIRYTLGPNEGVDSGYPQKIAHGWVGWPANFYPLDGAIYMPDGYGYFFKGDQYVKYDPGNHGSPEGAVADPQPLSDFPNWPSNTKIDDCLLAPNSGWVYFFFTGTSYFRYRP